MYVCTACAGGDGPPAGGAHRGPQGGEEGLPSPGLSTAERGIGRKLGNEDPSTAKAGPSTSVPGNQPTNLENVWINMNHDVS